MTPQTMTADALLQGLGQGLFIVTFVVVAIRAVRRPYRAHVHVALLFLAISTVVAVGWVWGSAGVPMPQPIATANAALALALPYLLLRLVQDFSHVPRYVVVSAEIGLLVTVGALALTEPPRPTPITLAVVGYFWVFTLYATIAFAHEARQTRGVTRRRMEAVAAGSLFLGLTILVAGLKSALPEPSEPVTLLQRLLALATGICYLLGFATPPVLRRAWQEPELRAFLRRAVQLTHFPTTESFVQALEDGTAAALGTRHAKLALWDPDTGTLRFPTSPEVAPMHPGRFIMGQVFRDQQPRFEADAPRADPENAGLYREVGAQAVLATPVSADKRRLGVLAVYADHAPIFAEDDLSLLELLADQATVILENRTLLDAVTRIQAREEAARLKEDFLSAAAHDLKTPLTTILAQAQVIERQAARNPLAPVEADRVQLVVVEAQRLKTLVDELLDTARAEDGRLLDSIEPLDLVSLAREVCARHTSPRHECHLEASGPVVGQWDQVRIMQLVENLVENAVKYSPDGGAVRVVVTAQDGEAALAVSDAGIGIPAADLPHVFDRFHRGTNVDDRQFAGMGLGLFICRGIVQEHGGQIWATSAPDSGTTFHVRLPLAPTLQATPSEASRVT